MRTPLFLVLIAMIVIPSVSHADRVTVRVSENLVISPTVIPARVVPIVPADGDYWTTVFEMVAIPDSWKQTHDFPSYLAPSNGIVPRMQKWKISSVALADGIYEVSCISDDYLWQMVLTTDAIDSILVYYSEKSISGLTGKILQTERGRINQEVSSILFIGSKRGQEIIDVLARSMVTNTVPCCEKTLIPPEMFDPQLSRRFYFALASRVSSLSGGKMQLLHPRQALILRGHDWEQRVRICQSEPYLQYLDPRPR